MHWTVGPEEIKEIIGKLKGRKALGPDGIPNLLLKECKEEVAPLLTKLFTACLRKGYHPRPYR